MRKVLSLLLVLCLCLSFVSCTAPDKNESSASLPTESEKPDTSFGDTVSEEASEDTSDTSEQEIPELVVGIPTVEYPSPDNIYGYSNLNPKQQQALNLYLDFFKQLSEMKLGEEKVIPVDWDISEKDWLMAERMLIYGFFDISNCLELCSVSYENSYETGNIVNHFYTENTVSVVLQYNEEFEQMYQKYVLLNDTCDTILASLEHDGTEYSKVKSIIWWVVDNVDYDNTHILPDSSNAYGSIVSHTGVCDGYSKAVQILLSKAGIKSILVYGDTHLGFHAWNKVCVDGEWYNVDTTWLETYGGKTYMMPDSMFMGKEYGRYTEYSAVDNYDDLDKTYIPLPKATSLKYAEYYFEADNAQQAISHLQSYTVNKERTYTVIIENDNERQQFIKMSGKEITDKRGKKYIMTVTPNKDEKVSVKFVAALSW